MAEHFNALTPAEDERLALLIEDCAEVIHMAAKIQRHGYESKDPARSGPSNRVALSMELGQLQDCIIRLDDYNDLRSSEMEKARQERRESSSKWLHHQGENNG